MTINILLADDHNLMRDGLRNLLSEQPNMTVAGEARDGRSAVQQAKKLSPDVILMDISMPGLNGIDATRQILADNPKIKVIALSVHLEQRIVLDMLSAGAAGYLLKDCAFDEVVRAVTTVMTEGVYLSPRVAEIVVKAKGGQSSSLALLTPREREVLQLLAEGKKTKDIAETIKVSTKTVETYRQQIMDKLNIHSIAELTKFAIREGLTSL